MEIIQNPLLIVSLNKYKANEVLNAEPIKIISTESICDRVIVII